MRQGGDSSVVSRCAIVFPQAICTLNTGFLRRVPDHSPVHSQPNRPVTPTIPPVDGSPSVPHNPRGLPVVTPPDPSFVLVEGTTFCVSGHDGEIEPQRPDGLFVRDTRIVSRWQLRVDGKPVDPLGALAVEPFHGSFVGRAVPRAGQPEGTLLIERERFVAAGMREDLTVRNYGTEAAGLDVELLVEADFADLFQVKDRREGERRGVELSHSGDTVTFRLADGARGVRVQAEGGLATPGGLLFRIVVPAGGSWSTSIRAVPSVDGRETAEAFPADRPIAAAAPVQRLQGWRNTAPRISVENPVLAGALTQSERDLGALRIEDPEHPDDEVVAAGAPWFMALFGRDSLLTSYMMIPFAPQLALGTLRTLARLQGTRVDPRTEEEPGRILHEVRLGADLSLALGGESVYYGSIDATPLFVQLCGRALRWGVPADQLAGLRPAIDRALGWMLEFGDRDGDGFLEYARSTDRGLLNQGWKDSQDSMSYADGRLADGPIALAEVQGYQYAAFRAAAQLHDAWGEPEAARSWRDRAERLKADFHDAFWMPEHDFYAMALDKDKRPLDVVSSNIGHVLWTRLAAPSVVPRLVDRLLAPDMFTGFGIRTLSSEAARFNPASYHNGSVWPHDSTIAAAGMAANGQRAAAATLTSGLLDAVEAFGGQLPELFCGFSRADRSAPVPYPTSCLPQAWAAASPYELLRLSLDLHLDVPAGRVQVGAVPEFLGRVVVDGLRAAGGSAIVRADSVGAHIEGLPEPLIATA